MRTKHRHSTRIANRDRARDVIDHAGQRLAPMKTSRRTPLAVVAVTAFFCGGCTEAPDEASPTHASVLASELPSRSASHSPSTDFSVAPSTAPSGGPISEPGSVNSVPTHTPGGVVAITDGGDVRLINFATVTAHTIASYPPVYAAEGGSPVSFFLTDVATVPGGRILLSTCCEPAAGYIHVLNRLGDEAHPSLYGDDPEVDPSGRRLAMTSLQSVAILPATLDGETSNDIWGRGLFGPDDVGWSPNGKQVIFSLRRRLGVVEATATSLREARYVLPSKGSYWGSTAFARNGPLAVEIRGRARHLDEGPSQILRVDFASGRTRVFRSSSETITDLATDRKGSSLLWVEGGTLRWIVGGFEGSLSGDYMKASFIPG